MLSLCRLINYLHINFTTFPYWILTAIIIAILLKFFSHCRDSLQPRHHKTPTSQNPKNRKPIEEKATPRVGIASPQSSLKTPSSYSRRLACMRFSHKLRKVVHAANSTATTRRFLLSLRSRFTSPQSWCAPFAQLCARRNLRPRGYRWIFPYAFSHCFT